MKYCSFTIFCIFLLTFSVFAQNPADDDILKISTSLIQVDVTVTDKNGKVVTDLKPEDFKVFENGKNKIFQIFLSSRLILKTSQPKLSVHLRSRKITTLF